MLSKRNFIYGLLAVLGLLVAIIYSEETIIGAKEGIELCLFTVIPSIMPFIFLSALICNYWQNFRCFLFRPLCKLMKIPQSQQVLLIPMLIGGYPIGAHAVIKAQENNSLTKKQARRLLGFCSNAGPSFIFGFFSAIFSGKHIPLFLWLIQIASAIITATVIPAAEHCHIKGAKIIHKNISDILRTTLYATATICGWVILFRVGISILNLKTALYGTAILTGLLELTNGCLMLQGIPNPTIQFILASGMLSIGGLCVLLQTKTLTASLGLGLYIPGKVTQATISIFLASVLAPILFSSTLSPQIIIISLFTCIVSILILKKSSSILLNLDV